MRETTIRRLLVLVLCASGIVALWILADRSLSTPDAAHSDTSGTSSRSGSRAASPIRSRPSASGIPGRDSADPPRPTVPRQPTDQSGAGSWNPRQTQSQQYPHGDARPPAVRGLHAIDSNHDSITVRWDAVRYATKIAYYHVTLNGIPVGDTAGLQLTIDWFNDDMGSHFIRVHAVDVDGHRGRRGSPLVVNRPDAPSKEPSPTPAPSLRPTPRPTPSPTADPTSDPTSDPTADPTARPTPTPAPTTPPTASGSPMPGEPTNSAPGLLATVPGTQPPPSGEVVGGG